MPTLETGDLAPELRFKTTTGAERALTDLVREGPVLLVFYKDTCPVCQLALPFLARLQGGKLPVYAVSQDGSERAARFNDFFGADIETLIDDEDNGFAASNALGLTNVPSLFIIEPNRRISWSWIGFHRARFEELALRAGRSIFGPGDQVPEMKFG